MAVRALILCVLGLTMFDAVKGQTECSLCEVMSGIEDIQTRLGELEKAVKNIEQSQRRVIHRYAKDCAELYQQGTKQSGVYVIYPRDGRLPMEVFCDMDTDGGGWTVFQRRLDGSVDFYRGWDDYKKGFGNLNGEFWLGNENLHRLTSNNEETYELRVDLEDTSGTEVFAKYATVTIGSEQENYRLLVGNYSGNAGDSLSRHSGWSFSTKDRDNDGVPTFSCSVRYKGAWWYEMCHSSNLNGLYHRGSHKSYADGVNWHQFKGYYYSLKTTSMKIRPIVY